MSDTGKLDLNWPWYVWVGFIVAVAACLGIIIWAAITLST